MIDLQNFIFNQIELIIFHRKQDLLQYDPTC